LRSINCITKSDYSCFCSSTISDFNTFYNRSSSELHGLISGSAETKEQVAEGLGELLDVTSEKTLKEVALPITGHEAHESLSMLT